MQNKNIKPAGISWVITQVLLLVATWYNVATKGELGIVGLIFSLSLVVYFVSYLFIRNKK